MTSSPGPDQSDLWDPLAAWPRARKWIWAALAVLVLVARGPGFLYSLKIPAGMANDFFQEWSSARNYYTGRPIYAKLEDSARFYGTHKPGRLSEFMKFNAHPPPSVLLALPFGLLRYNDAALAWNLMSLGFIGTSLVLMFRELEFRLKPWTVFPVVMLFLLSVPFQTHMIQAQLAGALLLLTTGAWAADRRGYAVLAGGLVGAAAALKLFPGFLLGYFVLRGHWRAAAAGVVSLAAITGLTAAVLGPESYVTYGRTVLPDVSSTFQTYWGNVSLQGYWPKLFDRGTSFFHTSVGAVYRSPTLARVGMVLSCLAVLGLWARAVVRARSRCEQDNAFGLSLVAMLLVSPITWDHYFLLLIFPWLRIWELLPPRWPARLAFLTIVVGLNLDWAILYQLVLPPWKNAAWHVDAPVAALFLLPYQSYLLVGLFAMNLMAFRWCRDRPRVANTLRDRPA